MAARRKVLLKVIILGDSGYVSCVARESSSKLQRFMSVHVGRTCRGNNFIRWRAEKAKLVPIRRQVLVFKYCTGRVGFRREGRGVLIQQGIPRM